MSDPAEQAKTESPGQRLRIMLVIPTLDQSGAEKQLTLLATGLASDRFEVEVVVLTRGGFYEQILRSAGIRVTILGKRLKFDPVTLWRLRKLIRARQPDVIHSWLFAANAYVRLVSNQSSPPILVSERCVDVWKAGWQTWLDRRLVTRTAFLTGNSAAVIDFYEQFGFPPERMQVVPNAVIPQPLTGGRSELADRFDLPADAKIVGYVGRLAPQKRVLDLVWASQLLHQLQPQAYFLYIGDGPELQAIQRMLDQFDVREHSRLAGHLDDASSLVPHLDLLWLASEYEGQSNSLMEAMSAGIPVICSNIAANRELVQQDQTGFLVEVGDSVGFAQYADRLLADPQLAKRVGCAAMSRVAEQFTLERMLGQYSELYMQLAGISP